MSWHSKELSSLMPPVLPMRLCVGQVNDVNIQAACTALHACCHGGSCSLRMNCSLVHVRSALRLKPAACPQAYPFPAVQGTRSGKNVLGFAGASAIFLFGLPLVILAIAIGSGELQVLSSALPLGGFERSTAEAWLLLQATCSSLVATMGSEPLCSLSILSPRWVV